VGELWNGGVAVEGGTWLASAGGEREFTPLSASSFSARVASQIHESKGELQRRVPSPVAPLSAAYGLTLAG
jgi:hypothetical protein